MLGVGVEKDGTASIPDRFGSSVVNISGRMQPDAGMTVIVVIPTEESTTVATGVFVTATDRRLSLGRHGGGVSGCWGVVERVVARLREAIQRGTAATASPPVAMMPTAMSTLVRPSFAQ